MAIETDPAPPLPAAGVGFSAEAEGIGLAEMIRVYSLSRGGGGGGTEAGSCKGGRNNFVAFSSWFCPGSEFAGLMLPLKTGSTGSSGNGGRGKLVFCEAT